MNINNKKIIKLIFSSGAIVSTIASTGFTVISCGHKAVNVDKDWNVFKSDAVIEYLINIVKNTNASAWYNAPESQLSHASFVVDNNVKKITVTITWTKPGYNSVSADFLIQYKTHDKYYASLWECVKAPAAPSPNSETQWNNYKKAALAETATNLLGAAINSPHWKDFQWSFGTVNQIRWATADTAEFDTFGALTNDDASGYKGMGGQPIEDNDKKTITAIISKKGKNGAFDSDPIKAVATFKVSSEYKINDWVFTQVKQLQSLEKVKSLVAIQRASIKPESSTEFRSQNWLNYIDDSADGKVGANHHASSGRNSGLIKDVLERNNFHSMSKFHFYKLINDFVDINNSSGKGKQVTWKFIFNTTNRPSCKIDLSFDFMFTNKKDVSSGVNAFNYTWAGGQVES